MNMSEAIAAAAAIIIITRLISFRRRGRYRPGVALAAWLIIVAATCALFFGLPAEPITRALVAIGLTWLAVELINTGGNVAHLGRRPKGQK